MKSHTPHILFVTLLLVTGFAALGPAMDKDEVEESDLGDGVAEKAEPLRDFLTSVTWTLGCTDSEEKSVHAMTQYLRAHSDSTSVDSSSHFDSLLGQLEFHNRTGIAKDELKIKKAKCVRLMKALSQQLREDIFLYYARGTADDPQLPSPTEMADILQSVYENDPSDLPDALKDTLHSLAGFAQDVDIGCRDDDKRNAIMFDDED